MRDERYIAIRDFCRGHSLEEEFLFQLQEVELIRIVEVGERPAIHRKELHRLERMVRLHRDLEIGPQGLQAVQHLLEHVDRLREEIRVLRRTVRRLDPDQD